MKRALILANGTPPTKKLLLEYMKTTDLFVCADGGANIAAKYQLRPHFIIGDLDSINANTIKLFKSIRTRLMKDQNSTDLEKALAYVIRTKCTEIFVLGADGGRMDHSIGNLSALIKFSRKAEISFILNNGRILPVIWERKLEVPTGTTISLIPLTLCEGLITSGLKWNLNNEPLSLGIRESTSNIAVSSTVTIRVRRGNLIVFIADAPPSQNKIIKL
jgi:thiamine pyrophosphokinase